MAARHDLLDGKIQLYKRPDGRFWQCSATVNGKQYRASTKEDELARAKDAAEEWYLELRGMFRRGELVEAKVEKTFAEVAELFLKEFAALTEGQRNAQYVQGHRRRVYRHLIPFMGNKPISEITSGVVQDYRLHRVEKAKQEQLDRQKLRKARAESEGREVGLSAEKPIKPPARNTIHQEIVVIRQVLKTALRHRWITALPDLSEPYQMNGKVSHRAWFSPDEYRALYTLTQQWAKKPPVPRFAAEYKQLHDCILFMGNTGLRPDEVVRLEYRDVSVVDDDRSGETILEIECRGKRGYGPCKSTANAVPVFRRLQKRNQPEPTDRIFPVLQRRMFRTALKQLKLTHDREGRPRTFYFASHLNFLRLLEEPVAGGAQHCPTCLELPHRRGDDR